MTHYTYEVEDNIITVKWWEDDEETNLIVEGSKLIKEGADVEAVASAFADDLKQNNLDKFPLDPVDPVDPFMKEMTDTDSE